jgi:hypothetical protein
MPPWEPNRENDGVTRGLFPARRPDGTCSVAIRLRLPAQRHEERLRTYVAGWLREKTEQGIDVLADLVAAPVVIVRRPDTVDLVCDGAPGAYLWKDWLVDLAYRLPQAEKNSFEGFYDLVADRACPRWDDRSRHRAGPSTE